MPSTNNRSNDFLDKSKIGFSELVNQTQEYLVQTYNRARSIFTPASPFGQILQVLQNLTQLIFYYIEDALVEMNIYTAFKEKSVYGLARLAGHDPTRAISARGTLALNIKPGAANDLGTPFIYVNNNTSIMSLNTALPYIIKVDNPQEKVKIDLTTNEIYKFRAIQGEIEEQSVVSNGRNLQSYNFGSAAQVEQDSVQIFVNGEQYAIETSLYDMMKDEKACIVKTGIDGGVDVYFGNDDFGTVPQRGAQILCRYIKTSGIRGNIFAKSDILKWKFEDQGLSNIGEQVDLNEVFNVSVEKAFILGSSEEELDLTRLIAPKTSRALVLANPDNYIAFLSRFDFSFVDAYTTFDDQYLDDDNVVYLFLIPNVQSRLSKDSDYFTTNEDNFELTTDEKNALYTYIQKSGRQIVSTELRVVDPIITRYGLNIVLRIFDGVEIDTLKADIIALLSQYFTRVQRRDKIPKSDIIAMIETVSGVDSVNIQFISEKNEKAIRDGFYYKKVIPPPAFGQTLTEQTVKVELTKNANGQVIEDPSLGLDKFGDIVIGLNELPIIRGGWEDREDVFYSTDIKSNNISSINIVVDEILPENLSTQIMTQNKNILINDERKRN